MKHLIFAVLLIVVLGGLCGCKENVIFTYNGHSYISFNFAPPIGSNSGIVHDPDCPCRKVEK